MDPTYLEAIMAQLVAAFPDQRVTLVLRYPGERRWDTVATSDPEPARSASLLAEWVLKHFCTQEAVH